jgi:hypothetical protein
LRDELSIFFVYFNIVNKKHGKMLSRLSLISFLIMLFIGYSYGQIRKPTVSSVLMQPECTIEQTGKQLDGGRPANTQAFKTLQSEKADSVTAALGPKTPVQSGTA